MSDEQERAWEVVRRAFEERAPQRAPRRARWAVPVVAAALAVVVLAVVSPPGRAVFQRVREAVGVPAADPALFSLPAPGKLLVVSTAGGGTWLVRDNGLKRRLGPYTDAEWSPHGLYAVVTRPNELAALDLDTGIRWTLARKHVALPRWEGSRTDTRIAYFDVSGLRVVAGDGTGDHLVDAHALRIPAEWSPRLAHVIAYATARAIVVRDTGSGRVKWRAPLAGGRPLQIAWSSDGQTLVVVTPHRVEVFGSPDHKPRELSSLTERFVSAEFRPGANALALVTAQPATRHSTVRLVDLDRPGHGRVLFAGPGRFGDATWSPNGRWLLLDWRTANQWLFVGPGVPPRVHAVANIREEFPRSDDVPPRLSFQGRWCCG